MVLAIAAPASADDERKLEIGGRVVSYVRAPLAPPDHSLQQLSSSVWLEGKARMTAGTFAKMSGSGDLLTPSIERRSVARAMLREAYVGAFDGGFEVRVGHQIVTWGNADLVSSLDLFTARDYTFFSATPEAQKLGAPSVTASFAPPAEKTPLRVAAVVQPVFPTSRMLVPPTLPPNVVVDAERLPRPAIQNAEVGAKIGWAPGGWDAAIVAFRGYNHVPEAFFVGASNGAIEIGRTYRPIVAMGFEASATSGEWVLRAEGAYTVTENDSGADPRKQPTHADLVLGADHPLGDHVRVQAQAMARAHPRWLAPAKIANPLDQAIAKANAVTFDYTSAVRPGATLRASWTSEDERLEVELAAMAYFVGFDWVVQPMLAWRVFEPFEVRAGVQIFGGQQNSLGALHDYSGAFAQATYTF